MKLTPSLEKVGSDVHVVVLTFKVTRISDNGGELFNLIKNRHVFSLVIEKDGEEKEKRYSFGVLCWMGYAWGHVSVA
jgi:hypothetical protein